MTVTIIRPRGLLVLCGALVLAAAGPSAVRAQERPGRIGDAARRGLPGASTPAPAPGAPGGTAAGAAQQAPAEGTGASAALPPKGTPIGEATLAALGALRQSVTLSHQLGELGMKQGTSAEVKALGQRIARESEALQGELFQLLVYRGTDPAALPAAVEERSRHQQVMQRLSGLTGAEFDREYVLALREEQRTWVENLKRYRDETPGKDAHVKGWLDEAENTAEHHLTATRQVKQTLDAQRAAQR